METVNRIYIQYFDGRSQEIELEAEMPKEHARTMLIAMFRALHHLKVETIGAYNNETDAPVIEFKFVPNND